MGVWPGSLSLALAFLGCAGDTPGILGLRDASCIGPCVRPYSFGLAYPGGRTSEAGRSPEEAGGLPSGSPASGSAAASAPAPPPQPDVVIPLHPHGLARPRPLLPYKAALLPRDVGMSSHPLYRWGAEAPEVPWLAPGRRLVRKHGPNFTTNQPSSSTSYSRLPLLHTPGNRDPNSARQNLIQLGFYYLSIHSSKPRASALSRHQAKC